ncbi:hypothetical protein ACS0TY_016319 [Phlomoides rotata]
MASAGHDQDSDDLVTLVCSELNCSNLDEIPDEFDAIIISAAVINHLPSNLAHKVLKIEANRNRLVEESSYFRGLLSGSFSESGLDPISIHWNVESFASVLRIIYGCQVEISSDNFVPLYEAALFFGVDKILVKCKLWLAEVTSFKGLQSPQLCLYGLTHIWKYGLEHANDFILQHCTSYLARNFTWALSFNSYTDVPYELLCSCTQHPDLTVDSEKQLCDAILLWLSANTTKSDNWNSDKLCHKIRTSLLPLWFIAGKRRCRFFSKFVDVAIGAILNPARHPCTTFTEIFREGDLSHLRVRLTKYTQKVDISGCPQITAEIFVLSLFPPCSADSMFKKIIDKSSISPANNSVGGFQIHRELGRMLNFEAVEELDISNCPSFSLDLAIDCFCQSFPSLQTLKAAYFIKFNIKRLCQLVQKFPLLTNIDLTLDVSPVIPAKVSITASSSVLAQEKSTASSYVYNCHFTASLPYKSRPFLSNIKRLTLEGQTDISDSDLFIISEVCPSLSYINIKGCTSVSDHGISTMILKCKMLKSILACDTSFGNQSVLALCPGLSNETTKSGKHLQLMASKLLTLHIGGCHEITGNVLSELMSALDNLRSLCLREIQLVDDALYRLSGASLEMLDVSDTKVSYAALYHVICRNPNLISLKARGCRHLLLLESETKERKLCNPSCAPEELYLKLGKSCKLQEIELGWGFSFISLGALKPAIRTLRTLVVGLGGSLGPDGLKLLPSFCPMLESLILYFQVISDSAIIYIMKTLPYLQILALCYCFGGISPLCFKFGMPNLRILRLERVTPWMTNEALATLTENCPNLVKLSLIGCTLLDCEAQGIISSGWPGLTVLLLEECGEITKNGVRSLLDCHALEDLTIRHTGPGIPRNFIIFAASKLPMLRKISLDICDAKDGDYDLPSFADRCFLSTVKIARCKLQKSTVEIRNLKPHRSPVHKETLVLVWNSEKLARTVVKERL